jgi:hypothetical protein
VLLMIATKSWIVARNCSVASPARATKGEAKRAATNAKLATAPNRLKLILYS